VSRVFAQENSSIKRQNTNSLDAESRYAGSVLKAARDEDTADVTIIQ
jgi:hypothetical protein